MFNKFIFIIIMSLALAAIFFVTYVIFDFFYEVPRALKKILKILEERDKSE